MIETKQQRARVLKERSTDPDRVERMKRYALKFSGPYTVEELRDAPRVKANQKFSVGEAMLKAVEGQYEIVEELVGVLASPQNAAKSDSVGALIPMVKEIAETPPKFDKKAYQRELMRKRRAKTKTISPRIEKKS